MESFDEGPLKLLKDARYKTLKEWDISFAINGEMLINILNFVADVNTDIPMKFYKDNISIRLKSPDNVQYSEIDIISSDILDYMPNLDNIENKKNIIKSSDGDYKIILLDIKGTIDELEECVQRDNIVEIRIDTVKYKRIEFHCPGNIVIWSQLLDPTAVSRGVENLSEIVKRVRNDPNVKKSVAIIEPGTFIKICNLGGKGKKRDIDERIFVELDKKDGLYISSGDNLKGRFFELKPIDLRAGSGDYVDAFSDFGDFGNGNDSGNEREKKSNKIQTDHLLGIEGDIAQFVYFNKEYLIPFTKLKGLSPISVEIRTEKPIVIEQKPFNSVRAMLTVAPRVEEE